MSVVFDVGPMVAYLNDEEGAAVVRQLLRGHPGRCYAHAINLCEVFYPLVRSEGMEVARQVLRDLGAVGGKLARTLMPCSGRMLAASKPSIACP